MADVAKTPIKRKSVGGKPESAKKAKGNPNKTPGKGVSPKQLNASPKAQNATPKQQKGGKPQKNNPKGQNGIQKSPKSEQKQKNKQQEESQKKIKPFEGTAAVGSPKTKKNKNKKGGEEKKQKRSLFFQYKQTLTTGDDAAKKQLVKTISNKIKSIEDRSDPLTKSAKRKLNILKRIKRSAEDGTSFEAKDSGAVAQPSKNKKVENADKKSKVQQQKNQLQKQKKNQKVANKKPKIEIEEDEDDSEEESDYEMVDGEGVEGESGEGESDEGEDESDEEGEEEEDDAASDEDDESADEDDEEESDEEETPPPKQVKTKKTEKIKQQTNQKDSTKPSFNPKDMEVLQKNEIVGKNQNRYILFIGNIPYDTKKDDLKEHFQKCGTIKHIRIPTEKKSLKPRGFGYIELEDSETYQKCMSMHHTFLKGRRINVLYTVGGKKKGEEKKKEIKVKNFKLHALRKQGKLAGSKKETQKRSFRRKKQKQAIAEAKTENDS